VEERYQVSAAELPRSYFNYCAEGHQSKIPIEQDRGFPKLFNPVVFQKLSEYPKENIDPAEAPAC
jgi:hypothetical protein